jgi:NAD(P)-dependent dehydrogenase (short-subunit alcohol dehydrogenase family)
MSFSIPGFLKSQLCTEFPATSTFGSQSGRTYIVVGATSGLGLESARQLYSLNTSRLILTARNPQKTDATLQHIKTPSEDLPPPSTPGTIEFWPLDLDNYTSIQEFSGRVSSELSRIDGVLVNAGVMMKKYEVSAEGWEKDLQVNVISTALLAELLLPKLLDLAGVQEKTPRLVFVNSDLHAMASLKSFTPHQDISLLEQVSSKKAWTGLDTYSRSKLIQAFYITALCRKLEKARDAGKVMVCGVNPGYCYSNLDGEVNLLVKGVKKVVCRSTEDGAKCLTHALVVAGMECDGGYLHDCKLAEWSHYVQTNEAVGERVYGEVLEVVKRVCPEVGRV